MSQEKCIIDNKNSQKLIKLADGKSICENHAKLTPWQKEELIEKDANQVNAYIAKITNEHLSKYGLKETEKSYKTLLHTAAESDLMENVSPNETITIQNWILIKQITKLLIYLRK